MVPLLIDGVGGGKGSASGWRKATARQNMFKCGKYGINILTT
jgi:hypothetical protein